MEIRDNSGVAADTAAVRESTFAADMAAFDSLPDPLRAAMAAYPFKLAAEDARKALDDGCPLEELLAELQAA